VFGYPQEAAARVAVDEVRRWLAETGSALRVVFDGGKEGMPIIAGLVKSCGVDVNILSADIKPINGKPYGQMLIESPDDPLVRLQVIQYLADQGLTVKEVRQ
jgi:ABC-type methionine transport system ATPase subunit